MSKFEEVDVIREGEVIVVITENRTTGMRTFMIAKEFARDGKISRSSFLSERHIPTALRLLDQVTDRL